MTPMPCDFFRSRECLTSCDAPLVSLVAKLYLATPLSPKPYFTVLLPPVHKQGDSPTHAAAY